MKEVSGKVQDFDVMNEDIIDEVRERLVEEISDKFCDIHNRIYDLKLRCVSDPDKINDTEAFCIVGTCKFVTDDIWSCYEEWYNFTNEIHLRLKTKYPSIFSNYESLKLLSCSIDADKLRNKEIISSAIPSWKFPFSVDLYGDFKSINLRGAHFLGDILGESVYNSGVTNFVKAVFREDVNFCGMMFEKDAFFEGAVFKKGANFKGGCFLGGAVFSGTVFEDSVDFTEVRFFSGVMFNNAVFKKRTVFDCGSFTDFCSFKEAKFYDDASFTHIGFVNRLLDEQEIKNDEIPDKYKNVKVNSELTFDDTLFLGGVVKIIQDKFPGDVKYKYGAVKNGSFNRTVFEVPTIIDLNFLAPPNFSKCYFLKKFFIEETWSEVSKKDDDEEKFRFFKNYFLNKGDHFKEREYFGLEMIAKAKKLRSFQKVHYLLYDALSGYGNSIIKPMLWMFVSFISFGRIFTDNFCIKNGFFVSLVRTIFPIIDTKKVFLSGINFINSEAISYVLFLQTFISSILLFLLLLGIRNKFKIK